MSAEAVIAIATLAAAIVDLVRDGMMSDDCVEALCVRTPELRPELSRLRLSEWRAARTAMQIARGRDEAEEIDEARLRSRSISIAKLRATAREAGSTHTMALDEILRRAKVS